MSLLLFVSCLTMLFLWTSTDSLSSYLTQNYWCDSLSLGEIGIDIMNWPTVEDKENQVRVLRGDVSLNDGDNYIFGETLTVTLNNEGIVGSRAHQYCFEVTSPGQFEGPKNKVGCNGRRSILNTTTLVMPALTADTDGSSIPVQIFCAHSKGYGQVKITGNFTLYPPSRMVPDPDL